MTRLIVVLSLLLFGCVADARAENILLNGEFSDGTAPWFVFTDASHQFLVIEGEARIRVLAEGNNVQFYQRNLTLSGDRRYRLTFDARNTLGDDVAVQLVMNGQPGTSYGLDHTFDLTSTMRSFSIDVVTALPFIVTDARLRFRLDAFDTTGSRYYFDNVVLESDKDGDGVPDDQDNCPDAANVGQVDADEDGSGAACDCADNNANVSPRGLERCNFQDDDCDGCVDEGIAGCAFSGTLPAVFSFGESGFGVGQIGDLRDIATDPVTGRIYVSDSANNKVLIFDENGGFLEEFGGAGSAAGLFGFPRGIAVDGMGRVLVADADNDRVQVFDGDGGFLFTIGGLDYPGGVGVGADGRIYVADEIRLHIFDSSGGHLNSVGTWMGAGVDGFRTPGALAIDPQGRVHVIDAGNDRIQVLDADGNFLGSHGSRGTAPGQFNEASGITADDQGRTWVTDRVNQRIQVFAPDGSLLVTLNSNNIAPTPIAQLFDIHFAAGRLYVADRGPDEVWVLQPISDQDGDGFTRDAVCPNPQGDCNDSAPSVFPGATEVCDHLNNDCNDPLWPAPSVSEADQDEDGFSLCQGDCADNSPLQYPGAPELCDGLANDCDASAYPLAPDDERDIDGDGVKACAGDCNDNDGAINPNATEICNGIDDDCDAITDEDDLGLDTDADGTANACDNCRLTFNPEQLDDDLDGWGDTCDNCPAAFNPIQDDQDADLVGDDCDNCFVVSNRAQTDGDGDDEGDHCDLDDGLIYLLALDSRHVDWQIESGHQSWNLYRGSLSVLLAGGDYTQAPVSNPLAEQACSLGANDYPQPEVPEAGEIMFFLVTGVQSGSESGLGTATAGQRPNANPCPIDQDQQRSIVRPLSPWRSEHRRRRRGLRRSLFTQKPGTHLRTGPTACQLGASK